LADRSPSVPPDVDREVLRLAVKVVSVQLAELVMRLVNGESLKKGELKRYAAYVGPAYHSPEFKDWFSSK
jgi:hypothetical protein